LKRPTMPSMVWQYSITAYEIRLSSMVLMNCRPSQSAAPGNPLAMSPACAGRYFENNSLLITGGDRTDMILALLAYSAPGGEETKKFAGLLLTCGVEPPDEILELLHRAEVPVVIAEQDSYSVVSSISQMRVRISPADKQRISLVYDVVRRYVDVDTLFDLL